jgi:transposase
MPPADFAARGVRALKSAHRCKARDLLATVWTRELPGRTRRQLAVDLVGGLESPSPKLREPIKGLRQQVLASSSHPMGILGTGPAGAARILADVGDVAGFPDRAHFVLLAGTAPIDASSG